MTDVLPSCFTQENHININVLINQLIIRFQEKNNHSHFYQEIAGKALKTNRKYHFQRGFIILLILSLKIYTTYKSFSIKRR